VSFQKRLDLLAGSAGAGRAMWILPALTIELWSNNGQQYHYKWKSSFSAPSDWHRSLRVMFGYYAQQSAFG
jgi:hypothetical protein